MVHRLLKACLLVVCCSTLGAAKRPLGPSYTFEASSAGFKASADDVVTVFAIAFPPPPLPSHALHDKSTVPPRATSCTLVHANLTTPCCCRCMYDALLHTQFTTAMPDVYMYTRDDSLGL